MATRRREAWAHRAAMTTVLLALTAGCLATALDGSGGDQYPARTSGTSTPPPFPTWTTPTPTGPTASPPPEQPVDEFYVDPASDAAWQEGQWRAEGRIADANQIAKISRRPQGIWLTSDTGRVEGQARSVALGAAAAHRTPVIVLYNLPHRDCDGYSSGGAADADAYRDWLARVARGLGRSAPVVVLEPDGIAFAVVGCLSDEERAERYGLLADAVTTLSRQNGARVYLDAGNPGWIPDPAVVAGALRDAGIQDAAGFALNVSNFYRTQAAAHYGHRVAMLLGGAHFVIDTSRNGNGPAVGGGAASWCNPPGRALGTPPTTHTGDSGVDAFLWVKDPGSSDGACRPGAPPAGEWWPQYALQLAVASI